MFCICTVCLSLSGYDSDPDLESLWCGDARNAQTGDPSTGLDSGMSCLDDHPEGFSFLNHTSSVKAPVSTSMTASTSASNETAMFSLSSLKSGVFILNGTPKARSSTTTPRSMRIRHRLETSPGMDSGIEVAPLPAAVASSTPNSKVRHADWPMSSGARHGLNISAPGWSMSERGQVKRKSSQPIGNEQKARPPKSLQLQ